MTVTHEVYAFLVTASLLGFVCKADLLPPVSEISYEWIDPFTVRVSWAWERPANFPQGCQVQYHVYQAKTGTPIKHEILINRHYIDSHLTGETGSGRWNVTIRAVGARPCNSWKSINKSKTVATEKPKGELVKNFTCVMDPDGMNCSWIPLSPALNMSYRSCENTEENMKSLKRCDHRYSHGIRNGCYLEDTDVCVLVETDSELETFKPALVIPLPKMSIRENGDRLNLTWTTPDVGKGCEWDYRVCYKECEIHKVCQTIQIPSNPTEEGFLQIAYDDRCRYEFEFRVKSSSYCVEVQSDGIGFGTYGRTRPPAQPLRSTIVIASILSVVLSVSLVLTCYCFKRHRDIFCPSIPDPSAILKEMMVNGNRDLKTTPSHLYTPMPEAVEHCKLTLVTENSTAQEKSRLTLG